VQRPNDRRDIPHRSDLRRRQRARLYVDHDVREQAQATARHAGTRPVHRLAAGRSADCTAVFGTSDVPIARHHQAA
jgi:hypothetical protein